jgi:hypothetical protein
MQEQFEFSFLITEHPTSESDPTPTTAHIELKTWVDRLIEEAEQMSVSRGMEN